VELYHAPNNACVLLWIAVRVARRVVSPRHPPMENIDDIAWKKQEVLSQVRYIENFIVSFGGRDISIDALRIALTAESVEPGKSSDSLTGMFCSQEKILKIW